MKKGGRGRVPPNRSSFPLRFLRVLKSSFLPANYDPALIRPPPAFPPSRSASEISKATSCVARFGLPAARAFRASPALGRPSLPHSLVLSLSVPVCLPVCLSVCPSLSLGPSAILRLPPFFIQWFSTSTLLPSAWSRCPDQRLRALRTSSRYT